MPVDITIGFPLRATCATSGRSITSNDAILYAGALKIGEQVRSGFVKGRGEHRDAELASLLEECFMPLERRVRLLIEIVERAPVPEPALYPEAGPVVVDGYCVRRIGLQLDGVRPRRGRGLHKAQCALEFAVVIARQLGNDIRRMARPNRPAGDFNC